MNEFVSLSSLIWCIICISIFKNADPHGYNWPTVRLDLGKIGHGYIKSTPVEDEVKNQVWKNPFFLFKMKIESAKNTHFMGIKTKTDDPILFPVKSSYIFW